MRRLQLYVCVLLASLLVYTALQRSLDVTVVFGATTTSSSSSSSSTSSTTTTDLSAADSVHETTTSCYGSAENLRHLMLQETFQVCLCCDFGPVYSFN